VKLTNHAGSELVLTVLDYEYPDNTTEIYGADWLFIRLAGQKNGERWERVHPSMLTWDIVQFIDWLDAVRLGLPTRLQQFEFSEPWLVFERRAGDQPVLRAYIEGKLRPHWMPYKGAYQEDYWIDFPLAELDLARAIASLREELAKFPCRARNPHRRSPR
jgi:hypothetical protein